MASSNPLAVGAIDFGTTYSGWALSFLYEFESDPTKAIVKHWHSGAMVTEKTPSCVLIGPDKKFLAFGYEAENMYKDLADNKTHKSYYYFKRFKMMLNKKLGEKFDRRIPLEDEMGKSLPAVLVFSMAIKYLVKNLMKAVNVRQTDTWKESDIHWVLTVPAIWTDAAKQFMRVAANEAGIDNSRLSFALESEAASIYCRYLSVENTVDRSNVSISQFKDGVRYMILDAGGGTIDITVHEVTTTGQVKEVQSASGGGWGGILVDKAFEDLIVDIFTRNVYKYFKKNEPEDWLDLWRDFEVKKRSVYPDATSRTVMKFPSSLNDISRESTGNNLIEAIAKSRYAKEIVVDKDRLKFEAKLFRSLFDESIQKTVAHVSCILRNVQVKAILMVGGFAESAMLQNAVKKAFAGNGIDFVIPLDASSTILRGALIYGHSPKFITERVQRRKSIVTPTKPLVVGAIDFGTTYSGWAYSFIYAFKSDPTKAALKQWHSGTTCITTEKTPTCVLIGPDKKCLAFGYDAENMYKDLTDKKTHKPYYYFRRFKMMLNKKLGEKLDRHISLEDEMGKSLPAVLVFSMAIKYLVEDMLKVVEDRQTGTVKESDIYWVLTVPAIWTDAAKQFMRVAANEAGIEDSRLSIALEPEAASIYCRHLSVETTVDRSNVSISQFKAGTKYVILDAGGGTIDITVHEVTTTGQVKEVQSASGGGWGGILVDKAFEDLIVDMFTPDVYQRFKKNETEDWLDMWRDFEEKKRSVTPNATSYTVMKFPASWNDILRESTGNDLKEAIAKSRYAKEIEVAKGKLKFEAKLFRSFFDESIQKTIGHVTSILRNVQVKAILMVGGFAESPMLQNAVKKAFARNGTEIVIPLGASSTILRGALIYGHSPKSITERVLQYTYGIAVRSPFQEGVHPERHRIETDAGLQCDNIFDKHVERNQTVTVGEAQEEKIYTPTMKFQQHRTYPIYASTLTNPKYVDEGCTYIGKLEIEVDDPDDDLTKEIALSLTFSGTEIVVEAHDQRTGDKYSTNLNFLG